MSVWYQKDRFGVKQCFKAWPSNARLRDIWCVHTVQTHTNLPDESILLKYYMLLPLVHPLLLSRDLSVAPLTTLLKDLLFLKYLFSANIQPQIHCSVARFSNPTCFSSSFFPGIGTPTFCRSLLSSSSYFFFHLHSFSLGHHFHMTSPCSASLFPFILCLILHPYIFISSSPFVPLSLRSHLSTNPSFFL